MLDQYVEEIVLSEYAATHGVEIPAEKIAAAVRTEGGSTVIEKRDEMRRQKLIAEIAGNITPPSDAEIRAYYEQHPSEFRSGEEVHVRQILVHDEPTADEIVARLKKGESFRIAPGTVHYIQAVTDCDLLEASTPHLDDIVRLKDRYGREGTSAP